MRRALLLSVVLALTVSGVAQARPWLNWQRARHAMTDWGERAFPDLRDFAAVSCRRIARAHIRCDLSAFRKPGDNIVLTLAGSQDGTSDSVSIPCDARLVRGTVRVRQT